MSVILDANLIIERDWYLRSGATQALLAASKRRHVPVAVPEVVVREVVAAQSERRDEARRKARTELKRLRRLDGPDAAQVDIPKPPEPSYEMWLRGMLAEHHVNVIPIPEMTEALVQRALTRRKPFDANGRDGFRDAIIWRNVLDSTSSVNTTVFATANTSDFADSTKKSLHPDLVADLIDAGRSADSLKLVTSMEEAAHAALQPAREVVTTINERLAVHDEWADDVAERLRQTATANLFGLDDSDVSPELESGGEPFAGDIIDYELDDLDFEGSPTAVDALPLTDDLFAVVLAYDVNASYRVEISTSAFWRQPNLVPDDVDLSGDERSAFFRGYADGKALFDARYQVSTSALTEISIIALSAS